MNKTKLVIIDFDGHHVGFSTNEIAMYDVDINNGNVNIVLKSGYVYSSRSSRHGAEVIQKALMACFGFK